jgi:cell division protein FtsB
MREFQDRRRFRRLLHSRYVIGALFVVIAILINALWGIYDKYQNSKELERRMAVNLGELQARKQRLEGLNASLGTAEGREREIRDRFGVTMEGERTIILVDDSKGSGTAGEPASDGPWAWFTGLFR